MRDIAYLHAYSPKHEFPSANAATALAKARRLKIGGEVHTNSWHKWMRAGLKGLREVGIRSLTAAGSRHALGLETEAGVECAG